MEALTLPATILIGDDDKGLRGVVKRLLEGEPARIGEIRRGSMAKETEVIAYELNETRWGIANCSSINHYDRT